MLKVVLYSVDVRLYIVIWDKHFEGWERKMSKCFFTYIQLKPFSHSPLDFVKDNLNILLILGQ